MEGDGIISVDGSIENYFLNLERNQMTDQIKDYYNGGKEKTKELLKRYLARKRTVKLSQLRKVSVRYFSWDSTLYPR